MAVLNTRKNNTDRRNITGHEIVVVNFLRKNAEELFSLSLVERFFRNSATVVLGSSDYTVKNTAGAPQHTNTSRERKDRMQPLPKSKQPQKKAMKLSRFQSVVDSLMYTVRKWQNDRSRDNYHQFSPDLFEKSGTHLFGSSGSVLLSKRRI